MRNKLSKSMMVELLLEAGCATTKPMGSIELGGRDKKEVIRELRCVMRRRIEHS